LLDEMPLTANGKIDRGALGKLAPSSPVLTEEYVAPRDVLEFRIMKIWEEVLAVRPIGVRDNFFSLGGHSLSAVSLKARIEKTFHRELPLSTLFQNGTIEQQARMLRRQPLPQSWSPLVGIKTSGSRSPFFCVHPVGGNVLCYSALAQHFDQEQPFYGLQSMNWHEEAELPASFEETAARYIEAIREKQPHGPYFLGGWSIGGVLAFEMARQLQSQGQPVALLALMDSLAPVEENKNRVKHDDVRLLADLARAYNITLPRDSAIGSLSSEDLIKYAAELAEKEHVLPEGVGTRWIRQLLRLHQQTITDLLNYRPKIYAGQITLFCAKRNASYDVPLDDRGWGRLSAQPVDIYAAQGDHHSMLADPHAQTLARQLNDCLKARGIIDRLEHLRDDARPISLNAHNR